MHNLILVTVGMTHEMNQQDTGNKIGMQQYKGELFQLRTLLKPITRNIGKYGLANFISEQGKNIRAGSKHITKRRELRRSEDVHT